MPVLQKSDRVDRCALGVCPVALFATRAEKGLARAPLPTQSTPASTPLPLPPPSRRTPARRAGPRPSACAPGNSRLPRSRPRRCCTALHSARRRVAFRHAELLVRRASGRLGPDGQPVKLPSSVSVAIVLVEGLRVERLSHAALVAARAEDAGARARSSELRRRGAEDGSERPSGALGDQVIVRVVAVPPPRLQAKALRILERLDEESTQGVPARSGRFGTERFRGGGGSGSRKRSIAPPRAAAAPTPRSCGRVCSHRASSVTCASERRAAQGRVGEWRRVGLMCLARPWRKRAHSGDVCARSSLVDGVDIGASERGCGALVGGPPAGQHLKGRG